MRPVIAAGFVCSLFVLSFWAQRTAPEPILKPTLAQLTQGTVSPTPKRVHTQKSRKTNQYIAGQIVDLKTTKGTIRFKLFRKKAPITTANFLRYVRDGHYNGTIFHRVIPNFMVQGGGLTPRMRKKPTRSGIRNEADNGLKNELGTVAMARTNAPHSASAQFFINTKNNTFLNFRSKSPRGWGYCVFAKVIQGMDVVRAISGTPTTYRSRRRNVPTTPIIIQSATIVN